MTEALEALGRFTIFAARSLADALIAFFSPGEVARQFARQLVGALPLAIVAGLAVGIVVWLHLRGALVRLGGPSAVELLPPALALAVVLEFGPIGAGLIVAARAGASLGAELGAMRLSEQVDALELLGQSPRRVLVGPRVLACTLVLPLIAIFIDYLALAGSFIAETLTSGTTWLHYSTACLKALRLHDVVPATLKTLAFGFLAGTAGCFHGLSAAGGTEGVGRAATRGVVTAVLAVMLADVALVKLIQFLMPG